MKNLEIEDFGCRKCKGRLRKKAEVGTERGWSWLVFFADEDWRLWRIDQLRTEGATFQSAMILVVCNLQKVGSSVLLCLWKFDEVFGLDSGSSLRHYCCWCSLCGSSPWVWEVKTTLTFYGDWVDKFLSCEKGMGCIIRDGSVEVKRSKVVCFFSIYAVVCKGEVEVWLFFVMETE
jgi:hypothetical protein